MHDKKIAVVLAPLQATFIEQYLQKFSPAVMAALHVKDKESERVYVQEALAKHQEGQTFFYCIFDEKTDELFGALEIRSPESSRGQLYTWLHEDCWGKSIFQQALYLAALDYFSKSGTLYFDATVDVENVRSYKALKKAGFADIGINEGPFDKQFVLIYRNKNYESRNYRE